MPGPDETQWTEFSDFSGGLWERKSDRECPQNGLLEATDCYPLPGGGLAAFARMEPVSQTGIADNSLILGIWKLRPPFPQGRLRVAALQLNAGGAGVHSLIIYSMQVGGGTGTTPREEIATGTWNVDAFHDLVTAIDPSIKMLAYRDSSLGYRVWYNLPVGQTTNSPSTASTVYTTQGVYRMGAAASTSTVSSGFTRQWGTSMSGVSSGSPLWFGDIAAHQARLVATGTFNQLHNRLYMTSQGGSTGTTDFLDPLGEKAGSVTWMSPSQSDYMTVAKSQVGLVVCQGDMRNAYNRQVSFTHNYMQSFPVETGQGTFFMVQDDGCYMATQGGAQLVTPNFYGTPMNPGVYPDPGGVVNIANSDNQKLGQPTVAGDFLFAGRGYVMDLRTNAWFKSSFIPGAKNHTTDSQFFRMFCSDNSLLVGGTGAVEGGGRGPTGDDDPPTAIPLESGQVLHHCYFLENSDTSADTWNPSPSYTFTLPLIYQPHEQVQVREIVYHLDAFKPNSSVRVRVYTDRQDAPVFDRTYTIDNTGPQPVRCSGIKADGNWVKIRTTVSSDPKHSMPNEAPQIERIFVGTQASTRTSQKARKAV